MAAVRITLRPILYILNNIQYSNLSNFVRELDTILVVHYNRKDRGHEYPIKYKIINSPGYILLFLCINLVNPSLTINHMHIVTMGSKTDGERQLTSVLSLINKEDTIHAVWK
jgi:hypothetical protein